MNNNRQRATGSPATNMLSYIALGSNIGDRRKNIRRAIEELGQVSRIEVEKISSLYRTKPQGYAQQEDFLNAAARIRTGLSPFEFLGRLKDIERALGRKKTARFGPRIIDLDILIYGKRKIKTPRLTIPHPRMCERDFVLRPLQEIAPEMFNIEVIKRVSQMREFIRDRKARGRTIGFVPTMGYLHAGHLSLVRRAFRDCDEVVVSIFVNPTQFGPREDFGRYPRDIERDKRMLAACGVRVVFCPLPREMYPEGCGTYVDVPRLSRGLCGGLRPGHFQGVATVVAKLFNIISPDIAYFGQKDFQQACVIRRMVKDLNMPLRIKALPTVREPDGLAMSSRNSYLSRQQRSQAVVLCQSLKQAKGLIKNGEKSAAKIIRFIRGRIGRMSQARIDYVSVVNAQTLGSIKQIEKNTLIALAVYFGDTRLIDNVIITRDGHCVCPR